MTREVDAGDSVDLHTFRQAMRELAGAVSVITVCDGDDDGEGQRTGLTVTSVVSLSLEPAELLISVNQSSSSWPLLQRTQRFGVNVLSASQAAVAQRFAGIGGVSGEQRYADAAKRGPGVQARSAVAALLNDACLAHDGLANVGRNVHRLASVQRGRHDHLPKTHALIAAIEPDRTSPRPDR